MDTVGIEIPDSGKRIDLRLAAGMAAAGALLALGGGYALGNASDTSEAPATVIARGNPATFQDALDEAIALKRHMAAKAAEQRLDIRMSRVER